MAVPASAFYTDQSRWFMEQLLALEKGTENGGIYANKPGYHNTRANNQKSWPGNYSIVDAVDKTGPSDKAAAYDWTFPSAQKGSYDRIAYYTNLLLKSAKDLNDPRLNGWREFYGQADNDTAVEGWDTRYGVPASSDPSHLWHLHMSETRSLVGSLDNKIAALSVLKAETVAQWKSGVTVMGAPQTFNYQGKTWFSGGGTRRWIHNPQEADLIFKAWGVTWPPPDKIATAANVDIIYGPDVTDLTSTLAGLKPPTGTVPPANSGGLTEAEVEKLIDTELSELKITHDDK